MRVLQGAGGAMMVPVGRLVVLSETAKRDIRLSGALIGVDEESGKATSVERIQVRVD